MTLKELKKRLAACLNLEDFVGFAEEVLESRFTHARRRAFLLEEAPSEVRNPVLEAFEEVQTTLHEAMVVDEATWKAHCPRADHGHVLLGPLVKGDRLVGALAVTRFAEDGVFAPQELMEMNRLSLFFSTHLSGLSTLLRERLSPREFEVASLARKGMSNPAIAETLQISVHTVKDHLKSVFAKLGLRSRAELASL